MSLPSTCQSLGDWINTAPWRHRGVSLLLIPETGHIRQVNDLVGKRAIFADSGVMLALWTGHFHTEVRVITDDERQAVSDAIN